jgi:hypothetical protein
MKDNYAAAREFALAITINMPVWGSNVTRLGNALRSRYGIREVGFFDVFKGPYTELEDRAVRIAGDLDGESAVRVMNMARIIQAYEKAFWDAIYSVR